MEDIEAIVLLLEKILVMARDRQARIKIHVSFSAFVPKPHTPLQWAAREDVAVLEEKVAYLERPPETAQEPDSGLSFSPARHH